VKSADRVTERDAWLRLKMSRRFAIGVAAASSNAAGRPTNARIGAPCRQSRKRAVR
jgi:hypothetical protein